MDTKDKCPHCGALQCDGAPAGFYICRSVFVFVFHQSELCRERAANAALRKELEECKANSKRWQSLASGQIKTTAAELSELETLRARVRELEGLGVNNNTDDNHINIRVAIPLSNYKTNKTTLGEAMPRHEAVTKMTEEELRKLRPEPNIGGKWIE